MIRLILLIILIALLIFLIWYFFIKPTEREKIIEKTETLPKKSIKDKIFDILIKITLDDDLTKRDRNRILNKIEDIVGILKNIDSSEISTITKHDLEKLIGNYLVNLVNTFVEEDKKDVSKLIEGINLIKGELEKIYENYKTGKTDFNSELEFLKRKFGSS